MSVTSDRTFPFTLTGARALHFHQKRITKIWLPLKLGDRMRFRMGDVLWIREPWRTFVSLDGAEDDGIWHPQARRGAGVAFDAGGPGLSISRRICEERDRPDYHYGDRDDLSGFGRLRPAATMPIWASRSFGIVLSSCARSVVNQHVQSIGDLVIDQQYEDPFAEVLDVLPISKNVSDFFPRMSVAA